MKSSKYCRCGQNKTKMCATCSKVRMVLLLKNGNDHLKYTRGASLINPVWYSFLKYNRYELSRIVEKMEKRVREHAVYSKAANVLQFYENGHRNAPIHTVKL